MHRDKRKGARRAPLQNINSSTASVTSITGAASNNLTPAAELAFGTLKLDGNDQAPTTEQAGELLTLWKAYQALDNSDSVAQAELDGLVAQIQESMRSEQILAIAEMQLSNLSQDELMRSFQQLRGLHER